MKFSKLSEIDKIKELTGGDRVNIEGKFQNSFSAQFSGFMWFNCNDLPAFSGDKGVHVYERFLILLCDNVIPPEKRDAELLDKLKAEGEIIVNTAIKVLQQSIARGYVFTESDRTKNNRKNYKIQNNSLSLFLQDCCIIGEGRVTKKQFKEAYKNWCKENNYIYERPNSINKILVEDFEVEEFKSNTEYYRLTIKNY